MTPTQFIRSGDVDLAIHTWGSPGTRKKHRPVVVLVHGYPDSAEVWSGVAEQLAGTCHVVAYDVRGAGLSTAPAGSAAYALKHLVTDLAAVIDAVSPNCPVHLVGHDWGALQGWEALMSAHLQGRIASYTAAAPSLDHVGQWFHRRLQSPTPRKLAEFVGQALGSSYMLAFQLPLLPELTWKLGLGRQWPRLLGLIEGVQTAARPTQVADGYHGLGLYRANLLPRLLRPRPQRTDVPVQLLVMRRDRFVPPHLFDGVEEWAPNLRRTELDAGHWASLSHPQAFAQAITTFVQSLEEA
ncbi:MAG: short chain dehydrogenase domain protein [Moraxellaceae bacterium]|jgi:pimeloyl-ACP methyl ester carboxylesterase|nr:short chain dehydrogenase domain protein [Moraxellaceae bacterium]